MTDKLQGNRWRRERFKAFIGLMDKFKSANRPIRILDVGGRPEYWSAMSDLWKDYQVELTILNLEYYENIPGSFYNFVQGDACNLNFEDQSFDIVHSNSVIEHVGVWANMRKMANEIRRVAPHYYVQTPNFWFPYELHYRFPLIQFLPESIRARMLLGRRLGFFSQAANFDDAMSVVQSVNLLTSTQCKHLFPDATIRYERVLGIAKSIMAMR